LKWGERKIQNRRETFTAVHINKTGTPKKRKTVIEEQNTALNPLKKKARNATTPK